MTVIFLSSLLSHQYSPAYCFPAFNLQLSPSQVYKQQHAQTSWYTNILILVHTDL